MMTNVSSSGTWTVNATCPKCGKPYMYIGDPVGDISQLICTCPKDRIDWFGWYPTAGTATTITLPDHQKRIADALERIAAALEAMMPAPKHYCAACGKETEFYVSGPYGAKNEDAKVCADCFDKLFEA